MSGLLRDSSDQAKSSFMHVPFVLLLLQREPIRVPIQNVKQIFSNWWYGVFRTPLKPLKGLTEELRAGLQTRHKLEE
jgi:hypothetical protein